MKMPLDMTATEKQETYERQPGDVNLYSDWEYAFTLLARQIVERDGRFYHDVTEEVLAAREVDARA
jgi:hypothetical protein